MYRKHNKHRKHRRSGIFFYRLLLGIWFLLWSICPPVNAQTLEQSLITGENGWMTLPAFTVGESINGYIPPGILDGIGAYTLPDGTVRALINHELTQGFGYLYTLANGAELRGGRISFFDFDPDTRQVIDAGLAYDTIIDRFGQEVVVGSQIDPANQPAWGLRRPSSSNLFVAGTLNAEDTVYLTGEDIPGGQGFALDVEAGVLYALPWLGRGAWESATLLDPGNPNQIAVLITDHRPRAPLLLYVGEKDLSGDFLERNGLAGGQLYVWVADSGAIIPDEFRGTGASASGQFVEIDIFDGIDFIDQAGQDALSEAAGAFQFSLPEDLATNPVDGTQVVLSSTGRGSVFPIDDWGATYLVDVDFSTLFAELTILYDGDDAGNGQFSDPDFGLRSPDNLDWADNGLVYIQEDRGTGIATFGAASGSEASIWELDPESGALERIGEIDRTAVLPPGQTDGDPDDFGDWETSGILDVTALFPTEEQERLLIANVQAHSVRDGAIASLELVEGGQLLLLSNTDPDPVLSESVFTLIDASTDQPVPGFDPIRQEAALNLEMLPASLNVEAVFEGDVGSVRFKLNGELIRAEFASPFALFGDNGGDFNAGSFAPGSYVLEATPFVGGSAGEPERVSFTVVPGMVLTPNRLVVVDANTNTELFELNDGAVIDAGQLPDQVNVVAKTEPRIRSVLFDLNGGFFQRLENVPPFALFGDISGDFLPGSLPSGNNVLTVTTFLEQFGSGQEGDPLQIRFTVQGSASKSNTLAGGYYVEPAEGLQDEAPVAFGLSENYPNPFNPETVIGFRLPESAHVQLDVYDMLGRKVVTLVDGVRSAGHHEVVFRAGDLPSGTYLYSLQTPERTFMNKMLLLK